MLQIHLLKQIVIQPEHDYNLDLDRIYLENTEPMYEECIDEEYNTFYTYDKHCTYYAVVNKSYSINGILLKI